MIKSPGLVIYEGSDRQRIYCSQRVLSQTYLEQVVETPGQDDDVVDIQQGHDHNGGISNTWREERGQVNDIRRRQQSREMALSN